MNPARTLRCGRFDLPLDRPLVMGIVNLTADSFSGDGLVGDFEAAVKHAFHQIDAGADLLDVGAESSRPGSLPVTADEEKARLVPVLDALRDCGVPVSVDVYRPEVMRAAIEHGAAMINDIYALRMEGALEAVAESDCAACLMHMRGHPATMQENPEYENILDAVRDFLAERVRAAVARGISEDRLILDPGFGFGKTVEHNFELLKNLDAVSAGGLPVLAGLSRKSMLGAITGRGVDDRVSASAAAALIAAQKGARVLRVHDVAATRDALKVLQAVSA
ncbi:MAG: dihydropteroate synthase [Candidatus Accumulibacter sp.]|jgi:dihydropteroate synthase|nr:dihydropteroate synthase [Accumulibacter sp.]